MIRQGKDSASAHVSAVVHGNGLTVIQWRSSNGATMLFPQNERFFSKRNVQTMQLEKKGDFYIMRAARYGEPLQMVGYCQVGNMSGDVLAGLFVCAHDSSRVQEAKVRNVRIDKPVPTGNNNQHAWRIVSRLETMDVFDGNRRVVYRYTGRIESPNWMPDGKELLFNTDGRLFTFSLSGGEREMLNTGTAVHLNGAHCISHDGQLLGIGNNEGRTPNILILPVAGGQPKKVVSGRPAYLHGLSPDHKEMLYVSPRKNAPVWDIYKQAIDRGDAIRLTDNQKYEFTDGCEYSPDGKYIYYNASKKGGTMQIWRMKSDGTGKEQLTFGAYNNWFPHISPDGKWMVFISYPPETPLNSHPMYAPVMIRLMPVAGGAPKAIAYLYGGQGSLDENAWSPDSKHIAFVSYTTQ